MPKQLTKKEIEEQEVPTVEYSEKEKDYRDYLIKRLTRAETMRNQSHPEFNDMDFCQWYETNQKAANAYIPPKKNKGDTNVVSGTTQEKCNTMLSAQLNYNLEPNIEAYNRKDLLERELGENMEDLIKKSRIMEKYDDKRMLIYKEFNDQGTVFIEEQVNEIISVEKDLKQFDFEKPVKDMDWKVKYKKKETKCEVNMIAGNKVYLGNIREFEIQKQPFIFVQDIITYSEAEMLYRNFDRWKYVPRSVQKFNNNNEYGSYGDWTLQELEEDMVEVIKYQDKWNNEFMLMVNGVMMLPIEFPLTSISQSGEYTIVKGIAEPISEFFAYGKSMPAKSKVDQETLDEMIKLAILKSQKSFAPPIANNSKKIISKEMIMPGNVINDLDPDALQPIGDVNGVSSSEFAMIEFMKKTIDEKTVSPSFMGQQTAGKQTATEINELKKQQLMKLGLSIAGIINLEKNLCWLRLHNILAHWTKPIDSEVDELRNEIKDVYRTVSVDRNLESGLKGQKIIRFDKEGANTLTSEQVKAEEDFLSEEGKPVRVSYLNPGMLANVKANWYINITPTTKNSSELDMVMMKQNIADAKALFGQNSTNDEYHKERWAVLANEDPDKYFNKENQQMPQEEIPQIGGKIGEELTQGARQPSLNKMVNQ